MDRYANQMDAPRKQPLRPAGINYPVIIRLVLVDASEEWRPGQAIKWTEASVLVRWESTPGDPRSATHAWLPTNDVKRVIRRPSSKRAGEATV